MSEEAVNQETLSNLAHETRHFEPSRTFADAANVKAGAYAEADTDRLAFWAKGSRKI